MFIISPGANRACVQWLVHLAGARRPDLAIRLVEGQAGRVEGQAAVRQQTPDLAFGLAYQVS